MLAYNLPFRALRSNYLYHPQAAGGSFMPSRWLERDRFRTSHIEAKGSASFLEKRSKKLFFNWAVLVSLPQSQRKQKFFAPLFFKKAATSCFQRAPS
jgi:hypothetical protein